MHKKLLKHFPTIIYIFVFSFLAVLVRGYRYGVGDQMIHLPLLYKIIDPTLFPRDSLFPLTFSHYTLVYTIHLFLIKVLNTSFFTSFTVLYFITNFLMFIGAFLLTSTITNSKKASFLSTLFFILAFPVGGSATSTVEIIFVPRFVSTAFLLFVLTAFFKKKYIFTFFLIAFSFLFHPLSGLLIFILVVGTLILSDLKKNLTFLVKGSIIFALITVFYWMRFFNNAPVLQSPFFITKEWFEILKVRNTYAFPLLWSLRSWFYLGISLVPFLGFLIFEKLYKKKLLSKYTMSWYFFITAFFIFFVQVIFTLIIPIPLIIQLQLGRIWLIPIIFSFVYSALIFSKITDRFNISLKTLKITMLVGLFILAYFKKDILPKPVHQDWIDVQVWANVHTNKSCTFLVDFYSQGFRVYSKRQIVGEYKDGALSFYSQDFARVWYDKLQFFNREEHGSYIKSMHDINRKYPFSLVVLYNNIPISLELVYRNDTYSIYKMPDRERLCQIVI